MWSHLWCGLAWYYLGVPPIRERTMTIIHELRAVRWGGYA